MEMLRESKRRRAFELRPATEKSKAEWHSALLGLRPDLLSLEQDKSQDEELAQEFFTCSLKNRRVRAIKSNQGWPINE